MVVFSRYLVTHLMGADLSNIVKTQKLTDDHVQFLVYQLLRGLKVRDHLKSDTPPPTNYSSSQKSKLNYLS